ncbi:MAG: GtrA family protein, partial [Actinomycetota bacterium]|nr:GtrA family protein [Actinomycetota bacterium]
MLLERYRALLRHPLRGRMTRFAISSVFAAATSAVVFPILYVLGASTTACSVVAFFAGAIPNWTLNRRWTWKVQGRVAFGREI